MVTSLYGLAYTLFREGRRHWGRLNDDVIIHTGITGHLAEIDGTVTPMKALLYPDGRLKIYAGSRWDFGSGPALNTPGMVRASLVHDAFCHLTNLGLVPWSVRKDADRLFRDMLKEYQPDFHPLDPRRMARWRRWAGVRLNSKFWAYWGRKMNDSVGDVD